MCLPTGLGKTHIASVLILNYYRWFPDGKIFFLAPTRPLVNQQRSSLASYYGLIDEDSITELKGDIPIPKRKKLYEAKRVFFMTPQTLDNDLRERRFQSSQAVLVIFGREYLMQTKHTGQPATTRTATSRKHCWKMVLDVE